MDNRLHTHLHTVLHDLAHQLPAQAPIRDFVHHNTLHAFQHLPFREAIAAAQSLTGFSGYWSERDWQTQFDTGRLSDDDLRWAIQHLQQAAPERIDLFPAARGDEHRTPLLIGLLRADLSPCPDAQLQFLREEGPWNEALWQRCLTQVRVNSRKTAPCAATDEAAAKSTLDTAAATIHQRLFAQFSEAPQGPTWRELLQTLTGFDLMRDLQTPLVRLFASHLDHGIAAWPLPHRESGLYAAWRASLGTPSTASGHEDLGGHIDAALLSAQLPDDAAETIAFVFEQYALPEDRWPHYLTRVALRLPGWFGMQHWHEAQAEAPAGRGAPPTRLLDGLAILLACEYAAVSAFVHERWSLRPRIDMLAWYFREHPAELVVRSALRDRSRPLPEALTTEAAHLITGVPNPAEHDGKEWTALAKAMIDAVPDTDTQRAWHLMQAAACLTSADDGALVDLNAAIAHLEAHAPDLRNELRLLAYERHYREKILHTLAANRREEETPVRPTAQLVFCMDEREEGLRRHLEELAPTVQTFGAAGFFGLPIWWRGLGDTHAQPLCPVVQQPVWSVTETSQDSATAQRHLHRKNRRLHLRRQFFHAGRHGLLTGLIGSALALPASFLALTGRVMLPRLTAALGRHAIQRHDGTVRTTVSLPVPTREKIDIAPPETPLAISDEAQADRVAAFMRMIGLSAQTAPLAPFIVIVGHGSHSLNNPHRSAYDCGACGGKHGGPNARTFARIANRPEVRQILADRGLSIPKDTVFLGAQHDTADDRIHWFDLNALSAEAWPALSRLRQALETAGARHATERCRRFASAATTISPNAAQRHVAARSDDFAQARPELGHVTNACAVIGRRALTRGSFLDRRAFLISYDPALDDDGRIIEGILLAAGPVGAGIALEYYFSTVNNTQYGCASKVMHNLCGDLGVLEGTVSDLRTGLPRQMIEIHEPMRLLVLCEQEPALLSAIVARQPALQELIGHGWISVGAISPKDGAMHLFDPALGWQAWSPTEDTRVPVQSDSFGHLRTPSGHLLRDHLPPGLLRPHQEAHA